METLAETDEVGLIRLEKLEEVTCMNESVHVLELTEAWDELDADGDGVAVALLDYQARRDNGSLRSFLLSPPRP